MRIRTTIASAALLSFGAGAASAASVTKSIDVDAPPAKVWAMIGPFCSISAWHPAIGKCTTDRQCRADPHARHHRRQGHLRRN